MKWLYVLIIFSVFTSGAVAGFQWRNQTAQMQHMQRESEYNAALAQAQQQARQREQSLQTQMDILNNETQKQLDDVIHFERAAADSRVREWAAQYAQGTPRNGNKHTPAAAHCKTERERAAVLAQLLGELDELAAVFASEADRNRITGKACEAAYAAARH